MPDYRPSTVTGTITKWWRAHKIEIRNDYGTPPSITFFEEERSILPDGRNEAVQFPPTLVDTLVDPNVPIPLIHPETGEQIGTATAGQLYAILYSLYFKLAAERDARG